MEKTVPLKLSMKNLNTYFMINFDYQPSWIETCLGE
jgi:hypothetical protein